MADPAPTPPELDPRWRRLAWAAVVVGFLIALVWLAVQVKSFTIPFLVAFGLAYILDPVVDWFEARNVRRTPAILVLLVIATLLLGGLIVVVAPQVTRELAELPHKIRELLGRVEPWIESTFSIDLPANLREAFDSLVGTVDGDQAKQLIKPVGKVAGALYGGTSSVLAFVIGLIMVPVFAFYLLRDFDDIVAKLRLLVPVDYRRSVGSRFQEIDQALSSFVRGQLTVAAILTVLYAIGLSIVGLPLALVVALFAGVGNLVPYLGTTIGIVLASLLALLDGQGAGLLVGVFAVFGVVQLLEGWVITPKIVGESVGLSSLAVIVAVLVFGELFGFVGVLLAVPLAAVLKILFRVALEQYKASEFFTGT